jgi:hypothetical protein
MNTFIDEFMLYWMNGFWDEQNFDLILQNLCFVHPYKLSGEVVIQSKSAWNPAELLFSVCAQNL